MEETLRIITLPESVANKPSDTKPLKGEIAYSDIKEIEQILFDGAAKCSDAETKRFWDGYSMCLGNVGKALTFKIQCDPINFNQQDNI